MISTSQLPFRGCVGLLVFLITGVTADCGKEACFYGLWYFWFAAICIVIILIGFIVYGVKHYKVRRNRIRDINRAMKPSMAPGPPPYDEPSHEPPAYTSPPPSARGRNNRPCPGGPFTISQGTVPSYSWQLTSAASVIPGSVPGTGGVPGSVSEAASYGPTCPPYQTTSILPS